MNPDQDPYYGRPEVSNSDLSILVKYWQPFQLNYDIERALRFGTLIDCMITEPQRIDYYKFTCAGWTYDPAEFRQAEDMKKMFFRDEYCRLLVERSDMQKITTTEAMTFEYLGYKFTLPFRMKADFDAKRLLKTIADLKSTTATSEKEFRKMIDAFSYDRQAAGYMDLGGVDQFVLVGVSKKPPYTVFKVPIARGDKLYISGREKLDELAFKHYTLFGHLRIPAHYRVAA